MEKSSAIIEKLYTHYSKKKSYECGKASIQIPRLSRHPGRHLVENSVHIKKVGKPSVMNQISQSMRKIILEEPPECNQCRRVFS